MRSVKASLLTLAIMVFGMAAPVSAVNYQDMWWNPSESGWGLNLTQQDDTLFAIWFVYAPSRKGTWFVASCKLAEDQSCQGTLYATTGPAYDKTPFDPAAVAATPVGTAGFAFGDANHATLTYSASGVTVSKNIVRLAFAALPIGGTYWIAGSGLRSGCGSPEVSYNYANAGVIMAVDGTRLDFTFKLYNEGDWNPRVSCTAAGPYAQWGSQLAFAAPFTCSDSVSGTLSLPDFRITEGGLTGQLRWSYGGGCIEAENISGVRHPTATLAAPGTLALGSTTYAVAESGGSATIAVTRTGGSSGRVTVGYATVDGTSKAGQDYSAMAGSVVFEDGDAAAKTITVPILADATVEGTETFDVVLSSPTGGAALAAPSTTAVTIVDDDTGAAGTAVGPGGGSVMLGGAVVVVPPGAVGAGASVTVNLVPGTADTQFVPDTIVASDAYRLELTGDLHRPITLQLAAKAAPTAGELMLAALVSDEVYTNFDDNPHRGVQLLSVLYADGKYAVTLPAVPPDVAAAIASKGLRQKALTSKSTATIWIFGGYSQRTSTHFNIRFPARGCSSLVMDDWLQQAEEAYDRLINRLGFTTFGTGMSTFRQDIDVVALTPGLYGEMGISANPMKNFWGMLDKFSLYFNLSDAHCNGGTPAQSRDMEATIGHEFFHIVQATYEPAHVWLQTPLGGTRAQCLPDASSTWFEGEMLDDSTFLGAPATTALNNRFYRDGLGLGCKADPRSYGYGVSTFLRHLTRKFGPEIVQSIWWRLRDGAGYNVPIDHMEAANIRVAAEWEAFVPGLLLGTAGLGWPEPPASPPALAYSAATPITIAGELPQLAADKFAINFTTIDPAKPPVCRARLTRGAGRYAVGVYRRTKTQADKVAGLDQDFTPTADPHMVIVTNVQESALVTNGARYGEISPFEVVIDCAEELSPCQSGLWEVSIGPVPSTDDTSCKLDTSSQTVRVCLTAKDGVVSARGNVCYSRLQSASGTIAADGTFSVDFRWGGYGTSALDGSGDIGEVVSGKFTGRMAASTTSSCKMSGPVSGEYHSWWKTSIWCASGFDIKQAYTATGASK